MLRSKSLSFVLVLSLIAVISIQAQFPMSVGRTADRERNDSERDLEQRVASMRYLISLADKRKPFRKKNPKLALAELQDDFVHLQLVNKDLVLTTSRGEKIDLRFVEKSAIEIHKRAERLFANLALPEPKASFSTQKTDQISDSKQLKKSITDMGWLIYWFVKNPIFKEVEVIDTSAAQKAEHDLSAIIELSEHVRKSCEELSKSN